MASLVHQDNIHSLVSSRNVLSMLVFADPKSLYGLYGCCMFKPFL